MDNFISGYECKLLLCIHISYRYITFSSGFLIYFRSSSLIIKAIIGVSEFWSLLHEQRNPNQLTELYSRAAVELSQLVWISLYVWYWHNAIKWFDPNSNNGITKKRILNFQLNIMNLIINSIYALNFFGIWKYIACCFGFNTSFQAAEMSYCTCNIMTNLREMKGFSKMWSLISRYSLDALNMSWTNKPEWWSYRGSIEIEGMFS